MEDGNVFIPLPDIIKFFSNSRSPMFSGNALTFKQPEISRRVRDFKLQMLCGILCSFEQYPRSISFRHLDSPMLLGISIKFLHAIKHKTSRFGALDKSGTLVNSKE